MAYDQAAMAAFAQHVIADCNGHMVTPTGESLNVDGRYGWQCMDLFIYIRYHLGFTDWLPTPDAASVWELNSQPDNPMWKVFDAITPNLPCCPGDIGIMNRHFFNNGVGHIFMIVADLGSSIRVLELNGLGDGREDDAGNQYGSPARIHDWPKTYLYGYLRWIGPAPAVTAMTSSIIPIKEEEMALTPEEHEWLKDTRDRVIAGVNQQPARADQRVADVGDVLAINEAIIKATQAQSDVTRKYLMDALLSMAQGIGDLKAKPAAAAPVIDVPALAAQLSAALNKDQAHQLLVELRNSLPTQ